MYRKNPLIKNIYDQWDISDEHPGMWLRTTYRMPLQPPEAQGYTLPFFNRTKRLLRPFGYYFDAPAGEQCFTKSFCSAKLMAMISEYFLQFFFIREEIIDWIGRFGFSDTIVAQWRHVVDTAARLAQHCQALLYDV